MYEEFKGVLLLDGNIYKISYSLNRCQKKVSIKNEKDITLMAARRITQEVNELINVGYSSKMLMNMKKLNDDIAKMYSINKLLKYSTISIELALKIAYPNDYLQFKKNEEEEKRKAYESPLEILNIGCTSAGKTLFILRNVLSEEAFFTFSKALTSIKETTACYIIYHVNSKEIQLEDGKICLSISLKEKAEVLADIATLILESFEEYIDTIQNRAEKDDDIEAIKNLAMTAIKKRLEMNKDKTFGLGIRERIEELSNKVEELINKVITQHYANSKSIERLVEQDEYYLIRQIIKEVKSCKNAKILNELMTVADQFKRKDEFCQIQQDIYNILENDINKFNDLYGCDAKEGEEFTITCDSVGEDITLLLSYIFGNKSILKKQKYFTIEPFVKCANIYVNSSRFSYLERELILSDSVGINQGQKSANNMKEVALNRVRASIVDRNPNIVLYHTKINDKDDYIVDVIKNLNLEGYGKEIHVIYGKIDHVIKERAESEGYEDIREFPAEKFYDLINEVNEAYIDRDNITLSSIIEDRCYICDKSSNLVKKLPYTKDYMGTNVLEKIINSYSENRIEKIEFSDEVFMNFIKNYHVSDNVYSTYLNLIPSMIPMDYDSMRWNTLQKAIDTLHFNGWGFDVLCPALTIRKIIANEFGKDEIQKEFEKLFADKSDEIKKIFLLKVTEIAQTVMVTEYKAFFLKLLQMRFDYSLRTDYSTSMTNDRKINLQRLYTNCLEKEGIRGEYNMETIFNVAWMRTIEQIKEVVY